MRYRHTNNLSRAGHRIRRLPTLGSDHVASIPYGTEIVISEIIGDWGKLHPITKEEPWCRESLRQFQVEEEEAWTLLKSTEEGVVYFEPTVSAAIVAQNTIEISKIIRYRGTRNILEGGHRVRRFPSLQTPQVATLPKVVPTIVLMGVVGNWGKLHPSMLNESWYRTSYGYQDINIAIEGWTLLRSNEGVIFYEAIPVNAPAPVVAVATATSSAASAAITSSSTRAPPIPTPPSQSCRAASPPPRTMPPTPPVSSSSSWVQQVEQSIATATSLPVLIEMEKQWQHCQELINQRKVAIELINKQQKQTQEINEDNLCIICQDEKKNIVLLPCAHLCLCGNCVEQILKSNKRQCPLCNGRITQHHKVFL